jgi:hypothetical protein
MKRTRPLRTLSLGLTGLIALVAAVVALGVSGGDDALAVKNAAHGTKGKISGKELALRNDMRRLWEDHVTWTRLAVISLIDGSPDTDATVTRLLRNQSDIGDAIKPFYGHAAGAGLTQRLREHILIAADLIATAKAGDQAKVAAEQKRWQQNAREIATFLSRANPRFWKRAALTSMLFEHLRLTTTEVFARLTGDWNADVASYDKIHLHALGMAEALSTGIVKQFPRRFR